MSTMAGGTDHHDMEVREGLTQVAPLAVREALMIGDVVLELKKRYLP
jgi:hypothetical protein